ncbi:MAG: sensor histidine kinase [Halomonas sp.]
MTWSSRWTAHAVPTLAILAFAAFLTFSLVNLHQVEQDMRNTVSENMLWVVTQAQVASHRLDEAVHRLALGDEDVDPELRYDVLSSRLVLMNEGPQRRYLAELGFDEDLNRALRRQEAIAARLEDLQPGAEEIAHGIHDELKPMMLQLNRMANTVMVEEWEATGARLDRHRDSLVQVIASVLGIMLSGLLLATLLLLALHRQLAARHLEQRLAQERRVSDFYRNFAAMVSHQFRTPLAVIDSGLQRLMRRDDRLTGEERQRRYRRLRSAAGQMTRLVESSLATAKLDGGQVGVDEKLCDLVPLVEHACRLQEEASDQRRIYLTNKARKPLRVRCDHCLVEQILANLLSNALKYSPTGSPVEVTLETTGGRVLCHVQDHGIGIAEEEQSRLFERFFRAPNAADTPGIGLGLNIARQLAHIQQGEVSVTSRPGEGTTFTFSLPHAERRHSDGST